MTINKLFAELEKDFASADGSESKADKVTVEYDDTYGFPTTITIDFVEEATDDELYLTISAFEALP